MSVEQQIQRDIQFLEIYSGHKMPTIPNLKELAQKLRGVNGRMTRYMDVLIQHAEDMEQPYPPSEGLFRNPLLEKLRVAVKQADFWLKSHNYVESK